jgi:hypothetical protein
MFSGEGMQHCGKLRPDIYCGDGQTGLLEMERYLIATFYEEQMSWSTDFSENAIVHYYQYWLIKLSQLA